MRNFCGKKAVKHGLAAAVAVLAFFALPALAQTTGPDLGLGFATATGLGTTDIRTTIGRIIQSFLGLLGIIAVVLIIYAGFLWMTAGGNEETVSKAKRILTQAVIGLVIITSAFAITRFIFGAITEGTGISGGLGQGCPPGQTCGGSFGGSGSGGEAFEIRSIVPAGAGPENGGWPKNYPIEITFSAPVNEADVTGDRAVENILVAKCNPLFSGGAAQPFNESACTAAVTGTFTASGNRVTFTPLRDVAPEEFPEDFEGDFWYFVQIKGGASIQDSRSRPLNCPIHLTDQEQSDWCERSVAFNQTRDVEPPTVTVNPPAQACQPYVQVHASASDDVLVSRVEYKLDGRTDVFVRRSGENWVPDSGSVNIAPFPNPFQDDSIFIDPTTVTSGTHELAATAYDGGGKSASVTVNFKVDAPHCCNAAVDGGETALNCGGPDCRACSGASCQSNAQCSSGYCNTTSGRCEDRPIIEARAAEPQAISPSAGGPGSILSINGRNFGSTPGRVYFLGADTDGDGNAADVNADGTPKADADDKEATLCTPSAWTPTQVRVTVPTGAVSGPVKIVHNLGGSLFDDTSEATRDWGWTGNFTATTTASPGICSLEPSTGPGGTTFTIKGSGLGASRRLDDVDSKVFMGSEEIEVAQAGWGSDGTTVRAISAVLPEGEYPVKIKLRPGTAQEAVSNSVNFNVPPPPESARPRIISVSPESGPVGTYVTIRGSGFGTRVGTVIFDDSAGDDEAVGAAPACSDNWHDTYVIVKVPAKYKGTNAPNLNLRLHKIRVETASPLVASNTVDFTVNNQALRPGICAILPDNGPAGIEVEVKGEGFGSQPANMFTNGSLNTGLPRSTVDFFKDSGNVCLKNGSAAECPDSKKPGDACAGDSICVPASLFAAVYRGWTDSSIKAIVPGNTADKNTWPKTGPVHVIAGNQLSANAVPFAVRDCKQAGASACGTGESCCDDGACRTSCAPQVRFSAYAWQMSTGVLPTLPLVIESSQCSQGTEVQPALFQSPSPYKGQQDACVNAAMFAEFNVPMLADSLVAANVKLEKCGADASEKTCPSPQVLSVIVSTVTEKTMTFRQQSGGLTRNTWYRVTLVSDGEGTRIRDQAGRALDGDRNNSLGGDYVWQFKTRDNDQPCALSFVDTVESRQNFNNKGEEKTFLAKLTAANCNAIQCGGNYNISWSVAAGGFATLPATTSGVCLETVAATAQKETPANDPKRLTAAVQAVGASGASKEGFSLLAIKFADPKVVSVEPNCTEACSNARVAATFNTEMDPATLTAGTVTVEKCRNASCNPPYLGFLQGTITTEPAQPVSPEGAKTVVFTANDRTGANNSVLPPFEPGTYYIVRLSKNLKSTSGVALTGLNETNFYSWKFKTRDDGTACKPVRAALAPAKATLYFVGERQALIATPFSAPDACSTSGQALTGALPWNWTIDPNNVLAGFLNGLSGATAGLADSYKVDAAPKPNLGCTSACLLAGSQNIVPQCGNGRVERDWEECDGGTGCTSACVFGGTTAGTCGNGTVEAGETCEKVGGQFPKGCKDPAANVAERPDLNGKGCVLLGASSSFNSVCGDRAIGDGEACDDGNAGNGDGCSSICLREGTRPSCGAAMAPGARPANCINYCGNGIAESGEDPVCEIAGTPPRVAPFCNPATCLKSGTNAGTCGNTVADPGEDQGCDTADGIAEFCNERCLLKGSSYAYASPSFCGDGRAEAGEVAQCEAGIVKDDRLDAVQVVAAGNYTGTSQDPLDKISTVIATTSGIPSGQEGRSEISLSCTCKTAAQDQAGQDAFCAGKTSGQAPACGASGCCVVRPVATILTPLDQEQSVCRNALVRLEFSQIMDAASVQSAFQVGERTGGASASCGKYCRNNPARSCATDQECGGENGSCVERARVTVAANNSGSAAKTSFLRKLWNGVVGAVRAVLFMPAAAVNAPTTDTYCLVPGSVTVITDPLTNTTQASFAPARALPASAWLRVKVGLEAKTNTAVSMAAPFISYFQTGANVCKIDRVEVEYANNASPLFQSTTENPKTVLALARPIGGGDQATIASIPGVYEFIWNWRLLPSRPTPVVTFDADPLAGPTAHDSAKVRVRGAKDDNANAVWRPDLDSGNPDPTKRGEKFTAKNGEALVQASALILDPKACTANSDCGKYICDPDQKYCRTQAGAAQLTSQGRVVCGADADCGTFSCDATSKLCSETRNNVKVIENSVLSASGNVPATVLLCNNPWPERRVCPSNGKVYFPWDPTRAVQCRPGSIIWEPFFDVSLNLKLYYCRDGQTGGGAGLEALKETPVVISPAGSDILKEYFFTFAGKNDAIGLRVEKNSQHLSIADWVRLKFGNVVGTPTTVGGYEALTVGKTVYVNAANQRWSCNNTGQACRTNYDCRTAWWQFLPGVCRPGSVRYPNVYILSHVGDSADTPQVFGQIVSAIDFNENIKDENICYDREGAAIVANPASIACTANDNCRRGTDGKIIPERAAYTCNTEAGVCMDGSTVAIADPNPVICGADAECRVGPDGKATADRADYYCDARQSKLARDVKRWGDLVSLRSSLAAQASTQSAPILASGTFLRAVAQSVWPSWQQAFAQEFGAVPPTDPINKLGYCALAGADPETCWNSSSGTFSCPANSNVYGYESVGPSQFTLKGDLESRCGIFKTRTACIRSLGQCSWSGERCRDYFSGSSPWGGATCPELRSQLACSGNPACNWSVTGGCQYNTGRLVLGGVNAIMANACEGTTVGQQGVCGDGIVNANANEECDPGAPPLDPEACSDAGRNGLRTLTCNTQCQIDRTAQCQTGTCGDGVVQPPETCDEGGLNGQYNHCTTSCTLTGLRCGDGQRQPTEACDCSSDNGKYSFNGTLPTGIFACSSGDQRSCAWDCSGLGPRCGDGLVNGSKEQCDGGFEEARGYCSGTSRKGCNTNADCPGGETCGNFCSTPEQRRRRTCTDNTQTTSGDDNNACKWSDWTCTAPGSCGNGVKETGEECDDGNTNNADGCVIDPANNVMCRTARCGDGYLQAGSTERCDNGGQNGTQCSPRYGQTCNYCTPSCSIGTVSGPYCGDNTVNGPQSTPPGPEQCDGTGAVPSYVCVSTKSEHQACGVMYAVSCATDECRMSCLSHPDSELCFNDPSTPNTDASTSCPAAAVTGIGSLPAGAALAENSGLLLRNSCDPDKDNDGVPALRNGVALDCNDLDPAIHPAFGSIAAAPRACGADHDCDGIADDQQVAKVRVRARGTIADACGDLRPKFGISYHATGSAAGAFVDATDADKRLEFGWKEYEFVLCAATVDKVRVSLKSNDFVNETGSCPGGDPDIYVDWVRFADGTQVPIAVLGAVNDPDNCQDPQVSNDQNLCSQNEPLCAVPRPDEKDKIFGPGNVFPGVPADSTTQATCINAAKVSVTNGTAGNWCHTRSWTNAIRCNGYFEVSK